LIVQESSATTFVANVFVGISPDAFPGSADSRATLVRDNWFLDASALRVLRPRPGRR
jgi:hypothetical protein